MARGRKGRERSAPGLPPLAPEAAARLAAQLQQVAAACAAGSAPATLPELVTPRPEDLPWDLHLMAGLANLKHPAIPGLLAALFGQTPDKARRKALKKALHFLKTQGTPVPPDLLPREEAPARVPGREPVSARVSPIFGNGDCYVILEGPAPLLGGNFLVCRLSEIAGVKECHLLSLNRTRQRELWEHFRQQGLTEWFSPPPALAVKLLEEAYARQAGGQAGRYAQLRGKIFQHWGRPEEAPELEPAPELTPGEEYSRLLQQSRDLAGDPLFRSWIPSPEEIAPWFDRLREVQESPLVLSDQQRQARLDQVLDEAILALYPPETRPALHRRLLLMAYFLKLKGRGEEARAAQAAARDLAAPEGRALTGENPFLKGLVQFALKLLWDMQQAQEAPAATGLVAPPHDSWLIRR